VRRRGLTQPGGPLPQPADGGRREAVAQRPGRDDELPPVVRLVGQGVSAEEDRVAGHGAVDEPALHAGKRAAVCQPRAQQAFHGIGAQGQGREDIGRRGRGAVHLAGDGDPGCRREAVQPEAAAVVEVGGDAPHGAAGRAGQSQRPEVRGELLHKERGDPAVDAPRIQDGFVKRVHALLPPPATDGVASGASGICSRARGAANGMAVIGRGVTDRRGAPVATGRVPRRPGCRWRTCRGPGSPAADGR